MMNNIQKNNARDNKAIVDVYADFNLDTFGLLLPERFTGVASGNLTKGISKILEYFSFPSLNILFSASGQLTRINNKKNQDYLKEQIDELQNRISIEAYDKNDNMLSTDHVSILGLNPSETEVTTATSEGGGSTTNAFQYKPNISAILKEIAALESDDEDNHAFPVAAVAMVASAAAQGLQLAFGGKKKNDKPKKTVQITQMASITGANSFSWYMHSLDNVKKDGLHYGTAFLQVSRKVSYLKVKAQVHVDWVYIDGISNVPSTTSNFEKKIPVYHTDPPKTALTTDFTSADSIPIVIPRNDIKGLLNIEDQDLDNLIKDNKLLAFGKEQKHISKGSLIKLLDL